MAAPFLRELHVLRRRIPAVLRAGAGVRLRRAGPGGVRRLRDLGRDVRLRDPGQHLVGVGGAPDVRGGVRVRGARRGRDEAVGPRRGRWGRGAGPPGRPLRQGHGVRRHRVQRQRGEDGRRVRAGRGRVPLRVGPGPVPRDLQTAARPERGVGPGHRHAARVRERGPAPRAPAAALGAAGHHRPHDYPDGAAGRSVHAVHAARA